MTEADKTTAICRDPEIRCGQPVLAGTRFPISQMLGELADGTGPEILAAEFDLEADVIRDALREIAMGYAR